MNKQIRLEDIRIRTRLLPGDLGYIAYLHGRIYNEEYNYGLAFERYVLEGLAEFAAYYNPERDHVWICEHEHTIIGFLIGFSRGNAIQLRYFILRRPYRGLGLGSVLLTQFLEYARQQQFSSAYLWTTSEQHAAAALYRKFGFRLNGEKVSDLFGKNLTEQRYELCF